MNYKTFMGQAQHRLELDELGPAVRVTRAVLTTLGERIDPGEATDLASPLPMEVDRYLIEAAERAGGEKFTFDEFLDRVGQRAGIERSAANYYSQTIVGLVGVLVASEVMGAAAGELGDVSQVGAPLPMPDLLPVVLPIMVVFVFFKAIEKMPRM